MREVVFTGLIGLVTVCWPVQRYFQDTFIAGLFFKFVSWRYDVLLPERSVRREQSLGAEECMGLLHGEDKS